MAEPDEPEEESLAGELSPTARDRLADIVELQPTKNAELGDRWGMDSGSDVHAYLEGTLGEYYYRDEDSLIRATAEASELVGGETLPTGVTSFEAALLSVLPAPDERSASVVSTLHKLQDASEKAATGRGPAAIGEGELSEIDAADRSTEEVRRALRALARKGLVEVVQRTVPTFRLKRPREAITIDIVDDEEQGGDVAAETSGERPTSVEQSPTAALEELEAELENVVEKTISDRDPVE